MMRPLSRGERLAVGLWLVLTTVAWNGIYDVLLSRGTKEYFFRYALHEAGQGPRVSMSSIMANTIADAAWTSTLWAGIILLAGLVTVRLVQRTR